MNQDAPDLEEIFYAARERPSPKARAAYLDEACGPDAALRDRVERLLAADPLVGGFLESPAESPTLDGPPPPPPASPETVIGPYRLLEPIGEGGMGTVYMAEQVEPVRRRVALKVIKPGMDSKQVVARFEAERQALALMDHPNIARVFDGGMTPSGRPYFVMELVRGLPITEYCDRESLSIPERLELFVLVCRAVQHAHQKGVIHRDLKPSNLLVTVIDDVAVPKVIDFGVAKATGQALTERTLFTGFHQFVGTPLYVSPEQAALSGVDVDTRSDIYSLGVLLYELLTGTTPFEAETLRQAAFDEMRRIIREEEPPRPSERLSTLDETLTTVSARRKADPKRLGSSLKGELDWVVMKALEKDRSRRYETASDFAADVLNYLADRPVMACPPSAAYRVRKFTSRNKGVISASVIVVATLVVGTGVSAWQAFRARAAEEESRRHAEDTQLVVESLINDVIGAAAPAEARGEPVRVTGLLAMAEETLPTRFRGRPIAEAAFRRALSQTYADLAHFDKAEPQIARAVAIRAERLGPEHPETLEAMTHHVRVLRGVGRTYRTEEAIRVGRHVAQAQHRLLGPRHRATMRALDELGMACIQHGDFEEARRVLAPAFAAKEVVLGAAAPETLFTLHSLAVALHGLGRLEQAEESLRRVVEGGRRGQGPLDPDTLASLGDLALVVQDRGQPDEAIALLREAVAGRRALHGSPYFNGGRYLCDQLVAALRERCDWAGIRELCEGWLRELLALPPEPDQLTRHLKMVTLSCMAFWLANLPDGVTFDGELALEAATRAAENGRDLDNNWTRLALIRLRLGQLAAAERALAESMARHAGGNPLDWMTRALILARQGDLDGAREAFDRAPRADRGTAPGVGYAGVRNEVATWLGLAPEAVARPRGPRVMRDEGSPMPREPGALAER